MSKLVYQNSDEYIGDFGVKIELSYTSSKVNNTTNWVQFYTYKDCTFIDNDGWYWNSDELSENRKGNTIRFFDEPHRAISSNGSWIGYLFLISNNKCVFGLSYGFNISNGKTTSYPLNVINCNVITKLWQETLNKPH